MKPLKSATQKNVAVDKYFYTQERYEALLNIDGVFLLPSFDAKEDEDGVRVSLAKVKDLKVTYSKEYETYLTVAVMNSGEEIIVNL